jgi:hypothetical protein
MQIIKHKSISTDTNLNFHGIGFITTPAKPEKPAQVNRYGYPYFHRKFASYGAVNGPYFWAQFYGTVYEVAFSQYTAVYVP